MTTTTTKPFTRLIPTAQDHAAAQTLVNRVINTHDLRKAYGMLGLLILENMMLTAECNIHRAALGYEPLPVYDPEKNRV